jgi:hypothetical protein
MHESMNVKFDISIQLSYYLINLLMFSRPYVHAWKLRIHSTVIVPLGFRYYVNEDKNIKKKGNAANLIEITNKMRPCSRIYYSNVS